jgi:hypothetical protein
MTVEKLEKHICDTIKEWQLKIGYQEESMKLYYPQESLVGLLGITNEDSIYQALADFNQAVGERLGNIRCSNHGERFCLEIPASGCKYIATRIPDSPFLKDFLKAVTSKGVTLKDIETCFRTYEADCIVEDKTSEGLGHVFMFHDTQIDDYVYCVESDDFGITYHRFVREDYEKLLDEGGHHHHHE